MAISVTIVMSLHYVSPEFQADCTPSRNRSAAARSVTPKLELLELYMCSSMTGGRNTDSVGVAQDLGVGVCSVA